ncbi:unnamed protein product [Orchesella dallaii]|uniref:Uncharacterized protein n=1 Tax=Orchesella dallaii TaxID=48710 RepID=A0ABP1R7A1_9HEXA
MKKPCTQILFLYTFVIFSRNGVLARPWNCGEAFQINKTNPVVFSQQYESDKHCKWELLGDKDLNVEVSCTVDLPGESKDCGEYYLQITDGNGGTQEYCGKTEVKGIRASKGLRDLFVEFTTSAKSVDKNYTGINCTAKVLSNPGDESGRLPTNMDKKVEHRCGGEDANFNEFPWLAALVQKGTRNPFCGAALINDRFILTAAHCFVLGGGKLAEEVDVLLHAHVLDMSIKQGWADVELGQLGSIRGAGYDMDDKTDADEKTQRFGVAEVILHPLFTVKYDYDFALLRLDRKIDLADSDAPTPVCLPPVTTFDSLDLTGANFTVSGWGLAHEKAGGTTRLLQKLVVPFLSREKCEQFLPNQLTNRMICFGYEDGKKDACSGDSGGPLVYQLPCKQWWQGSAARELRSPGYIQRLLKQFSGYNFTLLIMKLNGVELKIYAAELWRQRLNTECD